MSGRVLTKDQSEQANRLLDQIRASLEEMSGGDSRLLFYLRRRIFIRPTHDERGTPAHRIKLKRFKMREQGGKCNICRDQLPDKEAELDRFVAWKGYTPDNTLSWSITSVIADSRLSAGFALPTPRGNRTCNVSHLNDKPKRRK